MKKRFIVCIDKPTNEQSANFIDYIKSLSLGWWHWIDGVWFLVDSRGKLTAKELRDAAGEHFNSKRRFVVELNQDGDTWSGFGPKSDSKDMFKWIHNNWSRE